MSDTSGAMTLESWCAARLAEERELGPDTPPGDEEDLDDDALEDIGFPV